MMFESMKRCEEFVVKSGENPMDVDVILIVSGTCEKASLLLHETCRPAIRRAPGPGPDAQAGMARPLTA